MSLTEHFLISKPYPIQFPVVFDGFAFSFPFLMVDFNFFSSMYFQTSHDMATDWQFLAIMGLYRPRIKFLLARSLISVNKYAFWEQNKWFLSLPQNKKLHVETFLVVMALWGQLYQHPGKFFVIFNCPIWKHLLCKIIWNVRFCKMKSK